MIKLRRIIKEVGLQMMTIKKCIRASIMYCLDQWVNFFSLEIAAEVKKLVKTVDIKVLLKEFIGVFKKPKTLPSL